MEQHFGGPDQYNPDLVVPQPELPNRSAEIIAAARARNPDLAAKHDAATTAAHELVELHRRGASADELIAARDALQAAMQNLSPQDPES